MDDYEPDYADTMADYGPGYCPCCGAKLRYVELVPEADLACEICDECGYDSGAF